MKRKARRRWVIGGAVLLLAVAASLAFMIPSQPYNFLKESTLQNITIRETPGSIPTATGSVTVQTRITHRQYASQIEFDQLAAQVRTELLALGFREVEASANKAVLFVRKGVVVSAMPIPNESVDSTVPQPDPTEGAKTYVNVSTSTTFADRIHELVFRDKASLR
jgi:hypothetical protein